MMDPDVRWAVPKLRRPGFVWSCASSITIAMVGLFTKLLTGWFNKTVIFNKKIMTDALNRPLNVPLITISNHHSCFDDPGIWGGTLPMSHFLSKRQVRWALSAHDICFTNIAHSIFFMLGKCIPIVRGKGVYQPAVDFCIEKLSEGSWVHIFPEGKVNMTKEEMRLKWGVGRLIYECPTPPIIVPIWHEGMDDILPNVEPYIFKFKKTLAVNFGEPIQIEDIVLRLRSKETSPEEARKTITNHLQEKLYQLRDKTQELMCKKPL